MASKPDTVGWPVGVAATALAALAWWFASGVEPQWWLAWLAPLPVLWLAPRVGARWAALVGFAAYAAGGLNVWSYLHAAVGLPTLPVIGFILVGGAMLALCVLLYRHLLLRGRTVAAVLSVPALWVACEYVISLLSPHSTFFNIGYTQSDALPVIQIAAVTGLWGIGFLVLLVPAAIAAQTWSPAPRRGRVIAGALAALAVVATVVYGGWRLQEPATSSLRIGLASLLGPMRSADSAEGQALQSRYADAMGRLADAGAKIVLIPETSFGAQDPTIPAFKQLAGQRGLIVASGIDFKNAAQPERNMLSVIQPGAQSPATYNKHHLLLGLEHYTPGDTYTMLDGSPRTGLAICKDMDFHDTGHAYASRHTQLLLVPASDFNVDGWLHSRMAIMRGVESGFAIARAARGGRLTLSDDRGRVVAEASSEHRDAELVGDLPLHETSTLYGRWGDWFVYLVLVGLAVCLAMAVLPRRARR